ncbi:hypothetical protein BGZ99_005290 [Dissophora globulifera]|uniref:Uncharacterized protein n=1 Tax=Dissophora globulifera TaxID=979702 RepID=A0A9P6RHF4_9FUNG|nr:hypothetical protein BGZ99_005290 [Dissophora globulifera]
MAPISEIDNDERHPLQHPWHYQGVRCLSTTASPLNIPVVLDEVTSQHVVLWDDILLAFEDAKYLATGNNMVPFIRDRQLQYLTPKRMAYAPDMVYTVVRSTSADDASLAARSRSFESSSALSDSSLDRPISASATPTLTNVQQPFDIIVDLSEAVSRLSSVIAALSTSMEPQALNNKKLSTVTKNIQAVVASISSSEDTIRQTPTPVDVSVNLLAQPHIPAEICDKTELSFEVAKETVIIESFVAASHPSDNESAISQPVIAVPCSPICLSKSSDVAAEPSATTSIPHTEVELSIASTSSASIVKSTLVTGGTTEGNSESPLTIKEYLGAGCESSDSDSESSADDLDASTSGLEASTCAALDVTHGQGTTDALSQLRQMVGALSSVATSTTSMDSSLVLRSSSTSSDWIWPHDSFQEFDQLFGSLCQARFMNQPIQAASISRTVAEHFGSLEQDVLLDRAIQIRMMQTQNQVLSRLALIQNQVQAAITQSYEMHEFPIPRLFIVLPKTTMRRRDKLKKPFVNQFQLFFLCECGEHTSVEGSNIPNEIHLAKHEGYDIDTPREFFERYGAYVLTLMNILQFGVAAAGVVLPALGHLKLSDAITAIKDYISRGKGNVGAATAVENAIKAYYAQQASNNNSSDNNGRNNSLKAAEGISLLNLDQIAGLEGADLRQLESYLSTNDKGRILGNLSRIVTAEGNVKWVCTDHLRQNRLRTAYHHLWDIIRANGGCKGFSRPCIIVPLASQTLAKQFYDALHGAPSIKSLFISIGWDPTLNDLNSLTAAVTKANTISLLLEGLNFKGMSQENENCRYNPILRLISNGIIQDMTLRGFDDFFQRIDFSSMRMASQLRSLCIYTSISGRDISSQSRFKSIIRKCPSLISLELWTDSLNWAFSFLTTERDILCRLKRFSATISYDYYFTASHDEGHISGLSFHAVGFSLLDDSELIQSGLLTVLEVIPTLDGAIEEYVQTIMHHNPRLQSVTIYYKNQISPPKVDATRLKKAFLSSMVSTQLKRTIQIMVGFGSPFMTFVLDNTSDACIPRVSLDINMHHNSIEAVHNETSEVIRQLGSSITSFRTSLEFDDSLAELLDSVTSRTGSSLSSLTLGYDNLTNIGVACMGRVIGRSPGLSICLKLRKHTFQDCWRDESFIWTLAWHSKNIHELRLPVIEDDYWVSQTQAWLPKRHQIPKLEKLAVRFSGSFPPPQWIADVISAQPDLPQSGSPFLSLTDDNVIADAAQGQVDVISSHNIHPHSNSLARWGSLRKISLICARFSPDEWRTVIAAIDFSGLEVLRLIGCNFSLEHLEFLVEQVPEVAPLPSRPFKLCLFTTEFNMGIVCDELFTRLRKKMPLVRIIASQ